MTCPSCGSSEIYKNGTKVKKGCIKQELRCKECKKYFWEVKTEEMTKPLIVQTDKKIGEVHWRDIIKLVREIKKKHAKGSWSQDTANISITSEFEDIIVQPLSDTHLGALGSDYDLFEQYTDMVLNTPNLFLILVGDLADNFVRFKSMMAVHQQVLSPEQQDEFLEDWLNTIKHKVLCALWGNHEEFEEKATGRNAIKRILKHNVVYMDGIGRISLKVNSVEYKIVATHKTRYHSSFNLTHGLKQLARNDIADADVYIGGDKHNPAKETTFQRGQQQTFIQCGTLKTEDTHSKRYYSFFTSSVMPCLVLNSKKKSFTDFWTLGEALKFTNK